jgi:hypothetical protein
MEAIIASFRAATIEGGNATPELKALVNAGLLDALSNAAADPLMAPCVASFSALMDDLSQWLGYGGDSNFCVRFDGERLGESAKKDAAYLFPCFYDESNLLGMIERATQVANNQPFAQNLDDVNSFARALRGGLMEVVNYCHKASGLFKNSAFAAEQEWRIICQSDRERTQFRQRGRVLVPYIGIRLWAESSDCPIREIGIGPGAHQELNEAAVRCLLSKNELNEISVNISQVPFRKFH